MSRDPFELPSAEGEARPLVGGRRINSESSSVRTSNDPAPSELLSTQGKRHVIAQIIHPNVCLLFFFNKERYDIFGSSIVQV